MDELIALTCPNCGSSLHVPSSATRITCAYCNTPMSVERTDNAYFTERIGDQLDRIERHYLAVADGVEEVRRVIAMEELKDRQAYFRAHRRASPEQSLLTQGCVPRLILATAIAGAALLASAGIDGVFETPIDNIVAAALGGIGVLWGALVVADALRRRIGVDDEIDGGGVDDGWDDGGDDAIDDDASASMPAPSTTASIGDDDRPRLVDP
ncbi:MAG: hypothetical protein ABI780_05320 [Ardenticatenales bacterium]